MALIKSAVKFIIEQHLSTGFAGPMLTLGVPEIYASQKDIAGWYREFGRTPPSLSPSESVTTDNATGEKLGWGDRLYAVPYAGLHETLSIDIPGCEHPPDLVHDMNKPVVAHTAKLLCERPPRLRR